MQIGPAETRRTRPAILGPLRAGVFFLFAAAIILTALPGQAQDKQADPPRKEEAPVDANALSAEQVRLPKVGVNYEAITNFKPLAKAADNRDEWHAYQTILAHVSQVPVSALNRHGLTGLDPQNWFENPGFHLRELLSLKGRLIELQHKSDPNNQVKETYEGWILLYGSENQRFPVRIVLTELPEGFTLSDGIDEPIALDGYYFKVANFSGEKMAGNAAPKNAPIVIGRTFRVVSTAPPPANPNLSEAEQVALPGREFFSNVKDRRPLASHGENYDEYLAYTFVFEKIMQFSPEMLARNSRRDVAYADLINEIRDPEYLRKLLHVEGRIVRIRQRDASEYLKIPSVEKFYEAWMIHEKNSQHLIVVAFTELPEGMEVGEKVNYNVAIDGYYFKLLGYRSQEKDQKGKDVWRVAPLLVARRPILLGDPTPSDSLSEAAVVVVIGIIGIAIIAISLVIWFRVGDRRTKAKVQAAIVTNPFVEMPAQTVQPGVDWNLVNEDRVLE